MFNVHHFLFEHVSIDEQKQLADIIHSIESMLIHGNDWCIEHIKWQRRTFSNDFVN